MNIKLFFTLSFLLVGFANFIFSPSLKSQTKLCPHDKLVQCLNAPRKCAQGYNQTPSCELDPRNKQRPTCVVWCTPISGEGVPYKITMGLVTPLTNNVAPGDALI